MHAANKYIKVFLSLFFTLSIAFLITVLFFSSRNNPFTLRDVLKTSLFLSCGLFWLIWYLVLKSAKNVVDYLKKTIFFFRDLANSKSGLVAILFLLFSIYIYASMEYPKNSINANPIFKYSIEIIPGKENPGDICILEIKNSGGNVINFGNKSVSISGDWQENIQDCEYYIGPGKNGKILIDYIGPINDKFRFLIKFGPEAGKLTITSNPGKTINIDLKYFEKSENFWTFKLGNILTRKITDWGIISGYFSISIMLFLVLHLFSRYSADENVNFFVSSDKYSKFSSALFSFFKNLWGKLEPRKTTVIALFIIYILGVLYTVFIINPLAYGPSHFDDEIRYWNIALSIFDNSFSPIVYYHSPPFYPISLLPAFYFFPQKDTYLIAKLLNSLYLTSAIFPSYFLIRRFAKRNISLVVTAILLFNPVQVVIPGRILSENIFYPLLMWSILLAFTDINSKKQNKQIMQDFLFGISIALLVLTRYIALVLIPALLFVWWIKPNNNEKPPFLISFNKILRLTIVIMPIVLIIGLWLLIGIKSGQSINNLLGFSIAGNSLPNQLTFYRLIMWTTFYGSYAIILAAPFMPLVIDSLLKFKLKDWREERNRWLISLGVIILFLLIACIRHSWRASYNFPNPLKIQSRYIFYFNSLFLITSVISFNQNLKKSPRIKLFIFSSTLILLSFAVLRLGFVFIDGPLKFSVSSPFGRLMDAMGILFINFCLIISFVITLVPFKNWGRKLITIGTLVILFYCFGNSIVYKQEANSEGQLMNTQIHYLLLVKESFVPMSSNNSGLSLTLTYPENTDSWVLRYWRESLKFNGISDFVIYESDVLGEDPAVIFRAEINQKIINLRDLNEIEYLNTNNYKYTYAGKYFEYQVIENND